MPKHQNHGKPPFNEKYHIVHTESSGGWGGQEIRILNEAREFIQRDHPVTLVCATNSPIAKQAKDYQIPTIELPIGKKTLKGLWALTRWFSNNTFDIVNTHSSSDSWMAAIALRLSFNKKPLVRTRHVSAPVSNNRATRWLYHKASDYIVTTGEKLRNTLIKENGINPAKITSVPTGIDCQIFTPTTNKQAIREALNLPTDKVIIGILATLRSWKGHQYLIDAFKRIDLPNIHLLIVGDGPQWSNIQQQIEAHSLHEHVTLCGNQQQVTPWLQAMDIFALPSYANEGVPQGIMQAMACGLPIISTAVGSITEIVDNTTGIIVPTKNEYQLAGAIKELIENKEKRLQLGKRAANFSQQYCRKELMVEKMDMVFSTLLGNK